MSLAADLFELFGIGTAETFRLGFGSAEDCALVTPVTPNRKKVTLNANGIVLKKLDTKLMALEYGSDIPRIKFTVCRCCVGLFVSIWTANAL